MKIESFVHGCHVMGFDPKGRPELSQIPERYHDAMNAFYDMMVMTDAANKDKPVDIDDGDQRKQYPVFYNYGTKPGGSPGSGLVFGNSAFNVRIALAGSRLVLTDPEDVEYFATKHIDRYRKIIVPK